MNEYLLGLGTGETSLFMAWVTKTKRKKRQDRLVVLTQYRVLTVKHGRAGKSVQRSGHFYSMIGCDAEQDGMKLTFSGGAKAGRWDVVFHTTQSVVESMVKIMWQQCKQITPNFPPTSMPLFSGVLFKQPITHASLEELYPVNDVSHVMAFLDVFRAYAAYYNVAAPAIMLNGIQMLFSANCRKLEMQKLIRHADATPALFTVLMYTLEFDSWFTSVVVQDFPLGDDPLQVLVASLKENQNITSLTLSNVTATKAVAEKLAEAVETSSLTTLDISYNAFQDKGLLDMIPSFHRTPLRALSLAGVRAQHKAMTLFTQLLNKRSMLSKSLRVLDISGNRVGAKASRLLSEYLTSSYCKVRRIAAANCEIDLLTLLSAMKKKILPLTHLDLSGNVFTQECGLLLSEVLCLQTNIRHLNISHAHLSVGLLQVIFAAMLMLDERKCLVSINASHNRISDEGASKLASLLSSSSTLEDLNLNDCGLSQNAVAWIVHALVGSPALHTLSLNRNVLKLEWHGKTLRTQKKAGRLDHAVELAELVKKTPSLEILCVNGEPSTGHAVNLVPLLNAFRHSSCVLKKLSISGNMGGSPASIGLCDALLYLPKLQELDFDRNSVSVEDLWRITEVLYKNKNITVAQFPEADMNKVSPTPTEKENIERCRVGFHDIMRRNFLLSRVEERPRHIRNRSVTVALAEEDEEKSAI